MQIFGCTHREYLQIKKKEKEKAVFASVEGNRDQLYFHCYIF